MRSKMHLILLPLLILVTVTGIVLGTYNMRKRNTNVTDAVIIADGGTVTSDSISIPEIAPGESGAYTLYLVGDRNAVYTITMGFAEGEVTTLAAYVKAEITIGGNKIEEAMLTEYFDDRQIKFDCRLSKKNDTPLTLRFFMDESIGNEAQGATADFTVTFTANEQ